MTFRQSFYFAMRLSWRQLTYERGKLIAGLIGVMFACILVFMQLGFKDSLYRSVTLVPSKFNGQLFVTHKQTEAVWRSISFSRDKLMRAYAHPSVEAVVPLYIGIATWRNPEDKIRRTLMVYACDPLSKCFSSPEIDANIYKLTRLDTILYDELSHPSYGPITELIAAGNNVNTEVNFHKMIAVGTYRAGVSFASDGGTITSDRSFMRIFQGRDITHPDLGIIRLKPGSDLVAVQTELRPIIDEDLNLFTRSELFAFEKAYWQEKTPIGYIFGFGTIMGLVVGLAVVYQILYTSIANRINEFATLQAIGYSQNYMLILVLSSSLLFAVIGFIPGCIISYFLYLISAAATFIPMQMPFSLIMSVFFLIFSMCMLAGYLAESKVRSASPADIF